MMSLREKSMELLLLMSRMELSREERDQVIEILVRDMDLPEEGKMATVDSLTTLANQSQTKEAFLKKLETV